MNSRERRRRCLSKVSIVASVLVASFMLATIIIAPNIANASLGLFSLFSENIVATYISTIPPGAAFEGNLFHYYPEDIAVPSGTTIAWFNDDPGQLHTVTSGTPGDEEADSGRVFNSGGIPYGSFFQYTFDEQGTFDYYCAFHPWITGTVTVSAAFIQGHHFEARYGTGPTLNLSENNNTLLDFKPITIAPQETIPITYNISLLAPDGQRVFSESFFVLNNDLQVELINNATMDRTSVYGPDFSDPITGTYHVMGDLFETSGIYSVRVEIVAIGNDQPDERIVDEFRMQVTTPQSL